MNGVILLTGATGFLGTQIARRLLADPDLTVVALVRAKRPDAAVHKAGRAWWEWPELTREIGGRIQVVSGDIAEPRLGLADPDYDGLARRVTHIIHAAADLRLNGPLDEMRRTNVTGTVNVLALARSVQKDHGLARLSHVSTAYVAGRRQGTVAEDDLSEGHGFANAYECSKYESELLVRQVRPELPISVFRPGMMVGDSRTGAVKTFNTVYYPLRLYLTGRLHILPVSPCLRVNLIPVDYVAEAVVRLTFSPQAEGLGFHLTAPFEDLPTAAELISMVRQWAGEYLHLKLPRPVFLPLPAILALGRFVPRGKVARHPLLTIAPYLSGQRRFRRDNIDRLLGPCAMRWNDFLPRMLAYAVDAGFLHRSARTVHEQILFRLQSKSRPVVCHDMAEGGVTTREADEVRHDILAAAAALRSLGVRPGDRVALTGLNSTRYLILDTAIGLVGAVSVPLYYTSPPVEIDEILADSGAALLLVGAPTVLARLDELNARLPVVSFCRTPPPPRLAREVMPWPGFLALGAADEVPGDSPAGFGDVATLRYTSGTTGRPKGVLFTHGHLRWMAETMVSLLPWPARCRRGAYLSCLPMNHVVEGILATYSIYYCPAPVDIYFLEDIRGLRQALPGVRPTIFFSVPRVYERVWEAFARSLPGRHYLALREGAPKRLLCPLLRRLLLWRAGFDRCTQLIVGSAPPGQGLLRSFGGLGIELYNAYGLTEAPLISLNRWGANRPGTAGLPLPRTEVRVADDGELLVRGPQVTTGYFGRGIEQPFREGWLCTGDLGILTTEGDVVLLGRKKDLLVTSYGKNVHPLKVETALREIPGIREAMVQGDGKPYCTALLWLDGERPDAAARAAIDRGVAEANARLSRPEQVKRWAVLSHALSAETGDLTANLKLKRQVMAERYGEVINALYDDGPCPPGVAHVGRSAREL